jgi:hypothetical protein
MFFLSVMSLQVVSAQGECGIVDNITHPVESSYILTQQYAVPSPRHQGRFHTGEDWYSGRGLTEGQPVRAAAKGRVTYSYRLGWGRDGGVVIIQHTQPDGTIFYTQYGHLQQTETYTLPPRLSCVEQGDVLGVIGDARPAPHLHFEVRVINGADPGPGYTRAQPYDEGYRQPQKYITNLQATLNLAHRWSLSLGRSTFSDEQGIPPPLPLADDSLLYLNADGTALRRVLPDGRILWRQRYENPAVSVTGFLGQPLVTFTDGTMQFINIENGAAGDSWQIEARPTGAPLAYRDGLIFPAAADTLIALAQNRRDITQRWQNVPDALDWLILPDDSVALLSTAHELFYLSADGSVLSAGTLREAADLALSPDGALLVYSKGGLWQVTPPDDPANGATWTLYSDAVPGGGNNGSLLVDENRLYLFDGETLRRYTLTEGSLAQAWETAIPDVRGRVQLAYYNGLVLLTTSGGNIAVSSDEFGRLCNFTQIYGTNSARQWQTLGADNLLRFTTADHMIALDWPTFTNTC